MEIRRFLFTVISRFLILLALCFPLFAENSAFSQKIEWKSNANALEYKVEIQNIDSGKSDFITTDKTSCELSLVPGKYRYRVFAYDFLGRESSTSSWTRFDVYKAAKPKIKSVDEKITLDKNNPNIELNVNISDVNADSKFELVNENLEGNIDSSEKSKMNSNGSETESVSKIQFKDIPPGRWRLKVTNASGLSSVSDVIVVEGEKTYTEQELEKIRSEAENAVRKDMQENLDSYIKQAQAEKEAEARRVAAEKEAEAKRLAAEKEAEAKIRAEEEARLKAERDAAEKARLEAEKRLADERLAAEKEAAVEKARLEAEERRLAKEKEAAEKEAKRLAKLEYKRLHPYVWKDIIFEGGLGYGFNISDNVTTEFYETNALALNLRAIFLPWKSNSNKFGCEFAFMTQTFDTIDALYYKGNLTSNIFDIKFVWQHRLLNKVFVSAKAGLGLEMLETSLSYISSYSSRSAPEDKTYYYPAFTVGASLFFTPWKFLVFELGTDFSYVVSGSSPLALLVPYACLGFRF